MADPGSIMLIASTVFSAFGAIQGGRAQEKAYKLQARQAEIIADRNAKIIKQRAEYDAARLREDANRERAAASRKAIEAERDKRLTQSRALAIGAASGGAADDPTIESIQGDIGQAGEYNVLSELFFGDSAAANLTSAANLTVYDANIQADNLRYEAASTANLLRYKGRSARYSGYMDAASTIFSDASSLYDKYYGGLPGGGGSYGYTDIGGGDRIYWNSFRYGGR